ETSASTPVHPQSHQPTRSFHLSPFSDRTARKRSGKLSIRFPNVAEADAEIIGLIKPEVSPPRSPGPRTAARPPASPRPTPLAHTFADGLAGLRGQFFRDLALN
ncbi:hypothetical protein GWI33_019896, partial [Rhynchophorus ferrugineus]